MAGDHLNTELSFHGTVQVKTDAAVDFASRAQMPQTSLFDYLG